MKRLLPLIAVVVDKTLTSNRFSQLDQINKANVARLDVVCSYDTRQHIWCTSGLIEVEAKP